MKSIVHIPATITAFTLAGAAFAAEPVALKEDAVPPLIRAVVKEKAQAGVRPLALYLQRTRNIHQLHLAAIVKDTEEEQAAASRMARETKLAQR